MALAGTAAALLCTHLWYVECLAVVPCEPPETDASPRVVFVQHVGAVRGDASPGRRVRASSHALCGLYLSCFLLPRETTPYPQLVDAEVDERTSLERLLEDSPTSAADGASPSATAAELDETLLVCVVCVACR